MESRMKQPLPKKLNTKGCCFLCLQIVSFKAEVRNDEEVYLPPSDTVSLKCIQRHLQIRTKNLSNISSASKNYDSTANKEEIEVNLCQLCAKVIKQLSKSFLSLEKAQMEVNYWLAMVHQQIPDPAKAPELVQSYSKRMTSDPETLTQLVFVDNLRKTIAINSSNGRNTIEPKLELFRLDNVNKYLMKPRREPEDVIGGELGEDLSELHDNLTSPLEITEDDNERDAEDGSQLPAAWQHIKQVRLQKTYNCDLCKTAVFKYLRNLKRHKKTYKESQQRLLLADEAKQSDPRYKFECSTCGKKFPREQARKRHHETVHINQRNHECTICKKKFNSYANLYTHNKRVHFKIRENCKTCNKSYGTKYQLKAHEKKCCTTKIIKKEMDIIMGVGNSIQ